MSFVELEVSIHRQSFDTWIHYMIAARSATRAALNGGHPYLIVAEITRLWTGSLASHYRVDGFEKGKQITLMSSFVFDFMKTGKSPYTCILNKMRVCPGSARGTCTLELPNSFTVKSASASHGAEAVEFTTRREPQGDGASVEQFSEVIIAVWRYSKRNRLCRKNF